MLKCPACGRGGGPFRLRNQVHADNQMIRSWACPCGATFHAAGGAERVASVQPPYNGFMLEWNGRSHTVRLQELNKHDTVWALGDWTIRVAGPPSGPGTRLVTLFREAEEPVVEWRLEPGWGATEVTRRIRLRPAPEGVEPDLMARVIVRLIT